MTDGPDSGNLAGGYDTIKEIIRNFFLLFSGFQKPLPFPRPGTDGPWSGGSSSESSSPLRTRRTQIRCQLTPASDLKLDPGPKELLLGEGLSRLPRRLATAGLASPNLRPGIRTRKLGWAGRRRNRGRRSSSSPSGSKSSRWVLFQPGANFMSSSKE